MDQSQIPEISMHDLHARLSDLGPKDLILDVRTEEEYHHGHVPKSRNIPHEEVGDFADELKKFEHLYIHCQAGRRSVIAAEILFDCGLRNIICVTHSGMGDWLNAGYPVER